MDDLGGLDALLDTLEQAGSNGMFLAGENVEVTLRAARDHGCTFDEAWSMAINRVQPSQEGGVVDLELAASLREDRAILEENRPFYRAAYEGTPVTPRERAESIASTWRRVPEFTTPRRRRAA